MKFKEVAHLYLGCQVQVRRKNDTPNLFHTGTMVEVSKGSNHSDWIISRFDTVVEAVSNTFSISNASAHYYFLCEDSIKPLLLPLSSLTDEQKVELSTIAYENSPLDSQDYAGVAQGVGYITKYLLERQFDLYGLIPNGEAIDLTTLNNK